MGEHRLGADLRLPIGLMFVLLAGALVVQGWLDPRLEAPLTHINVNLYWGLVLLLFGVVMLALGWRAQRRGKA
jgi:hypothetical protein